MFMLAILLETEPHPKSHVFYSIQQIFFQDCALISCIHLSIKSDQLYAPAERKASQKHDAPNTMLMEGMEA